MLSTTRSGPALWIALVGIELNIGIHAALMPMHLEETFYIGVLFAIGNAALFLAMLAMVSPRTRALGWSLAAATSVAEFGGFVASRTVGLPHGYKETWAAQPEDLLGLVCLVTEVVVVALALVAVRHAVAANRAGQRLTATPSSAYTGATGLS